MFAPLTALQWIPTERVLMDVTVLAPMVPLVVQALVSLVFVLLPAQQLQHQLLSRTQDVTAPSTQNATLATALPPMFVKAHVL